MKRRWKIYWIACGICLGLGMVCCIAAFSLGFTSEVLLSHVPGKILILEDEREEYGGEWSKEVGKSEEIQNVDGDISILDIDMFAGEVNIYMSTRETIGIQTSNISERVDFRCQTEGKTLRIKAEKKGSLVNNVSVGTVDIYIPETMTLKEASIDI